VMALFAVSYGYLEYYYINDPVQGKLEVVNRASQCKL
jgi:hypothetical protein